MAGEDLFRVQLVVVVRVALSGRVGLQSLEDFWELLVVGLQDLHEPHRALPALAADVLLRKARHAEVALLELELQPQQQTGELSTYCAPSVRWKGWVAHLQPNVPTVYPPPVLALDVDQRHNGQDPGHHLVAVVS